MSVRRRITAVTGGALILLLVVAGVGIGGMAWVGGWHSAFGAAIQESGALTDAALLDKLDALRSGANAMLVVIAVVAVVAAAVGTTAVLHLGRSLGRQLQGAVAGISGSAAELLAVSSEVAAATAQTAAATNETTATVEEVKQTATLAQERASEASRLAQDVVEASKFGEASANRNYVHFEHIQADMDVVAEAIRRLSEEAQSVGDVIATVNDLAEQSNLLSVNASIEAAKAGEAGRGFSVVAQEVKNLATQSKQAVAQVGAVLTEIQKASAVVVRAVEQSGETIELGRDEAKQGLENIGARVIAATAAAEATTQIATMSAQQLAGMEQINQAVLSINAAGSQSVAGTRQVEKEVERLQEMASALKRLFESQARGNRWVARQPSRTPGG